MEWLALFPVTRLVGLSRGSPAVVARLVGLPDNDLVLIIEGAFLAGLVVLVGLVRWLERRGRRRPDPKEDERGSR